MQGQQVHLLGCFDHHETRGWSLHGFRNRFSVTVVVLVPLEQLTYCAGIRRTSCRPERSTGGRCDGNKIQPRNHEGEDRGWRPRAGRRRSGSGARGLGPSLTWRRGGIQSPPPQPASTVKRSDIARLLARLCRGRRRRRQLQRACKAQPSAIVIIPRRAQVHGAFTKAACST